MSYTLKTNIANANNYGLTRPTVNIKYVVVHMTANDGDHDESNANFFKNNVVYASAHYFVDDDSVTQSVPDNRVAYSVGGSKWNDCSKTGGGNYYGKCTNDNSISVELCDTDKNGVVYPTSATIENAIELIKTLMKKYNVPQANVIRHFDVNGKHCPSYWMDDAKWNSEFWSKLSTATVTTSTTEKTTKPSIVYRVYANSKWTSETKDNTVCGTDGKSVKAFMVKLSDGSAIKYRSHLKGGKWLPWVTGYNGADANNGYAGDGKTDIDAIEIKCDKYDVRYNVSTTSASTFVGEVKDSVASGSDSYAGVLGKPIDKIKIRIV